MPVETAKVIHQLDDSNPRATDPKSQGDDHLRLLKTVLQTSFNGYEGVVALYGADEGTANAYAVNPEIPVPLYGAGMVVAFEAASANTGPATMNVSGLGAIPIVHTTGLPLEAGDIRPGMLTILQYDGTKFQATGGSAVLSRVGNQTLTGDLDIIGDVSVNGDFSSSGSADIGGDATVAGSLDVQGESAILPGETSIGDVSALEISRLNGVSGPVAAKTGETYSGQHDFRSADVLVPTLPFGAPDSENAASIAFVNQAAFSSVLPAQEGNTGRFLRTNGSTAYWAISEALVRRAVTSSIYLGADDQTKLIDCSGAFVLRFDPVATLGNGWYCYIRNGGTGDITLDPSGSEKIDDLTSYIMYPGEVRLVQCDGVALRSIVLNSFYRVFTQSGNFIKPPGYTRFSGLLWGGGAGGTLNRSGGGAGCSPFLLSSALLASSEPITIGAGGAANGVGGTSTFSICQAQGGQANGAGGGAGIDGNTDAGTAERRSVIYGGGFGGASTGADRYGGNSIFGGGGGGGVEEEAFVGRSIYGGNGGVLQAAGHAPGGGGGRGIQPGSGARGELRIWGVI